MPLHAVFVDAGFLPGAPEGVLRGAGEEGVSSPVAGCSPAREKAAIAAAATDSATSGLSQ